MVKPLQHVFLMINTTIFKQGVRGAKFMLAMFISCIISGPIVVGIGS